MYGKFLRGGLYVSILILQIEEQLKKQLYPATPKMEAFLYAVYCFIAQNPKKFILPMHTL